MLNFGNQFPFRILFRILSVIVVNCNLIIFVLAAWPIKSTEGSKPGKKHSLPIDLSTENKKSQKVGMRRRGARGGPLIKNGRTVVIGCHVMKCSVYRACTTDKFARKIKA